MKINILSKSKAEQIAFDYLNQGVGPNYKLVIISKETIEFSQGFVFSANTERYITYGEKGYRISGLPPIIVDKSTGEVFDSFKNKYIYPEELIEMYLNR